MKEQISIALKGMAMGIAEVIPGVSGGTIAFITGIYQRLLQAINAINFSLVATFKKGGFHSVWNAIDGTFLVSLFAGMAVGVIGGIFTVARLLHTHPEPLWGFFFGLIIASILILRKEVKKVNFQVTALFALGAAFALLITNLTPTEGSTSLPYVFMSGLFAICALMLPGISGSFILLILGMYTIIIPTVKNVLVSQSLNDIVVIAVFAFGCLVGVMSFARVLSWLFHKQPQGTMATMIGFLLGSVHKIWPWRNVTSIADKHTGSITNITDYNLLASLDKEGYKILSEQMVIPSDYLMSSPKTVLTLFSLFAGFVLILIIDRFTSKK